MTKEEYLSAESILVRIDGTSCEPYLNKGKVYKVRKSDFYDLGDFIVFWVTDEQRAWAESLGFELHSDYLVKQVSGWSEERYAVRSTQPNGVSSNCIGLINKKYIIGKIECEVN